MTAVQEKQLLQPRVLQERLEGSLPGEPATAAEYAALPGRALQEDHQPAHGRVAGQLLVPGHVSPHGVLQVHPLQDRRRRGEELPDARDPDRRSQEQTETVDQLRPARVRFHRPERVQRDHARSSVGHPHERKQA